MFKDFANVWTIVGGARDLKRAPPLAMRVAGCVLVDHPPRRGIAVSFDNEHFVRRSISGLGLLNASRLPGTSMSEPSRCAAAP